MKHALPKQLAEWLFRSLFLVLPCTFLQAGLPEIDSLQQLIDGRSASEDQVGQWKLELGNIYMEDKRFSESIFPLKEALDQFTKSGDASMQFRVLKSLGHAHHQVGQSEPALEYLLRGLKLTDSLTQLDAKADFLFLIGDYFRLQHHVDASIQYLEQAAELYEQLDMEEPLCGKVRFTLAGAYKVAPDSLGKMKAVEIYREMLNDDCLVYFDSFLIAKIHNNLGSTFIFVNQYEEAERHLRKALAIKEKLDAPVSLAYTLNEFASLYYFKKDYKTALPYAKKAADIMTQQEDIHLAYNIEENLALLYRHLGDYKSAMDHMNRTNSMRDSMQSHSRTQALTEMEVKYQSEMKEQALARQALELDVQQTKNRSFVLLLLLLLFVSAFIFLWYRVQWKQKASEAQTLEELDHLKTRYFSNISHELRTPLSLIIDPLQRLRGSVNNPDQLALINLVSDQAQHMLRLVNQMLDLRKLEADKMRLQVQQGNLTDMVKTITDVFFFEARQKKIQLNFVSEQNDLDMWFDPEKLEKVFYNLLSNALKFTPAGGRVDVMMVNRPGWVEVIVKDNGPGIPAAHLDRVFDRFFQIDDSDTRSFAGSGIGLSLVKELVELHHGRVIAESRTGAGTTMRVFLPAGRDHLKPEDIRTARVSLSDLTPKTSSIRLVGNQKLVSQTVTTEDDDRPLVLIVEDHRELRHYLKLHLEPHYRIIEASNGKEGLAQALEHLPDLVVSDVMMPIIDGHTLCKQLKKDGLTAHIPIILLTAKTSREERLAGLKHQADDYLNKPFDSEELLVRIENLIEQRRQLRLQFSQRTKLSPSDITVNSADETFLTELLQIVESKMEDEGFGVEELSRSVGLSRSQLHRKLKALTGLSTSAFIKNIRLQRAFQLLDQQAGNASEIAFQVGFSNPNYFYKCFKEAFDLTPGQVLKGQHNLENTPPA